MCKRWLPVMLVMVLALVTGFAPVSAAPSAADVIHVVQRGETLYGIARRYGVDMLAIASANNIVNPNLIYVGQRLVISAGQPAGGTVHVVQPGENLFRIGLRYGVSALAIASANGIANPNFIHVGQRLTIPGAGSVSPPSSSGFELAGQTLNLAYPDKMKYAGMEWAKFQVWWSPGMAGSAVTGQVQHAHNNGLKVLLSVVGKEKYPSSIDFAAYVEFLRQVAAVGPDAIEVWNEPNVDREWPAGRIDPAAYVQQMLAPAYSAIKAANPNTLVVSGAPAPTGYFGGRCTGAGCDDAPYISGMAAAGAARYMDCIGIHYNEGVLSPSRTSGDPRGYSTHYTRYFWGMVNTYYDRFGGQRQLCFTELGYLSPEGHGALPGGFAWAAGTSVAEQAAWLAEAASLSASSGKVRLMVVYNVDYTLWRADDPQAGYAMMRPDGSCPACETLHAVMGSR